MTTLYDIYKEKSEDPKSLALAMIDGVISQAEENAKAMMHDNDPFNDGYTQALNDIIGQFKSSKEKIEKEI